MDGQTFEDRSPLKTKTDVTETGKARGRNILIRKFRGWKSMTLSVSNGEVKREACQEQSQCRGPAFLLAGFLLEALDLMAEA